MKCAVSYSNYNKMPVLESTRHYNYSESRNRLFWSRLPIDPQMQFHDQLCDKTWKKRNRKQKAMTQEFVISRQHTSSRQWHWKLSRCYNITVILVLWNNKPNVTQVSSTKQLQRYINAGPGLDLYFLIDSPLRFSLW